MEIQGKIIQVLAPQKFTTRNGEMTRYSFILETTGNYPKKVKFDVLRDEAWGNMNVQVGMMANVSFDADSREWQGRWYTSLTCWRVQNLEQAQRQAQQQQQFNAPQPNVQATPQPVNENKSKDDLPF